MKDDRLYLIHMQECMERVISYTADGREAFMRLTLIQDAVIRNLQTMSESSQRLSDDLKRLILKLIGDGYLAFVMFWFMTIWASI